MTAAEALQHAWFNLDKKVLDEPIPENVLVNVRGFKSIRSKESLNSLVVPIGTALGPFDHDTCSSFNGNFGNSFKSFPEL